MKTILLKLAFLLLGFTVFAQTYQNNFEYQNFNAHDLNIEPINDGTGDVIVIGNLFNGTNQYIPVVKRISAAGNVVWSKTVSTTGLSNLRLFDCEIYLNGNMLAVTGSVDVNGVKKAFISTAELGSGLIIDEKYFEIVSPNFNTTALHISYTEKDADADGNADPGFIVGGFFSNSYSVDVTSTNLGFVLRTDTNLNELWTIEVDNSTSGTNDFNMVNNITETSDGYFLTGAVNDTNTSQQAVLAHKIDASGTFSWDSSYVVGNAMDVSVDAYYDASSNLIYMLSNYSVYHHFGVTTLDNSNGNITQKWVDIESNNNLNYYGFTIDESYNNPNNLIITGYSRDNNFVNVSGSSVTSQTNIFVHEFDRTSGMQQGHTNLYNVPHTELVTDEYNFWNGQMPLIYYPEISTWLNFSGVKYHNVVGYFTPSTNTNTQINLFRTLSSFESACLFDDLNFITSTIYDTAINNVTSGTTPITPFSLSLTYSSLTYTATNCSGEQLSVNDSNILNNKSIYPNPFKNTLYITDLNASKYQIYDLQGRVMSAGSINQNRAINVTDLKEGVYFIKTVTNNNQTNIFKVIKN